LLNNVTFKRNDTATYTIYNAKPTLFYRDSRQRAEITGNDTIVISGGSLEVDIDFNWEKKTPFLTSSGTGSVRALSDEIAFAKGIIV
jgi:hypothetical protein